MTGASLTAILALTFYLRFLFFGQYIDVDVGNVAYMGWRMAEGEVLIDREGPGKPPLYPMLYAGFVWLFGPSVLGLKLFGAIFVLMAVLAIYWVGQRAYGRATGLLSALLFGVFSSGPMVEGGTVNLETLLHLPSLLSIGFFLKAHQTRQPKCYLVAGIFGALATLVKQVGGVVFLAFLFSEWPQRGKAKEWLTRFGLIAGGALIPLLGIVSFYWYHGFSPAELFDSWIVSNFRYIQRGHEYSDMVFYFLASMKKIVHENSLLWIGTLFSSGLLLFRKRIDKPTLEDRALLWWALWSFFAVWIPGTFYAHYFLQLIAPFSILTAYGILWGWEKTKELPLFLQTMGRGFWAIILFLSTFFLINADYKYFFTYDHIEQTVYQFKGLDGVYDSYGYGLYNFFQHQIATYLRASTWPSDTLYIWGMAPQVYYLSQRRAAASHRNNFNLSQNVTRDSQKALQNYADQVIQELSSSPPTYILKIMDLESFPELKKFVQDFYEIDKNIDPIMIHPFKIELFRKKGK